MYLAQKNTTSTKSGIEWQHYIQLMDISRTLTRKHGLQLYQPKQMQMDYMQQPVWNVLSGKPNVLAVGTTYRPPANLCHLV